MKSSHYLAIVVKLFSIALALFAIRQSALFIEAMITGSISNMPVSPYYMAATSIVPLFIAVILWCFPICISKSILSSELDKEVKPIHLQTFLAIIISSIGIYTCFYAIVDTVYWLVAWFLANNEGYRETTLHLNYENNANMVATAIELAVSIFLIFKSTSLARKVLQVSG